MKSAMQAAAQILKIESVPDMWSMGLPLGNGRIGVMCWRGEKQLRFSLDHCEAWDLRHSDEDLAFDKNTYKKARELVGENDFESIKQSVRDALAADPVGPTKVSLGRIDVDFEFDEDTSFELNLADAVFKAKVKNCKLEAFVSKVKDVFCLKFNPRNENVKIKYIPFYETSPGLAALNNPEIEMTSSGSLDTVVQQILPDKFFAICWNNTGSEIFISISYANSKAVALAEARAKHPCQSKKTFLALKKENLKHWKSFWSSSAVVLPEKRMNFLWYYGVYIMAASAIKGCTPPGLQGLWAMDKQNPPWRGAYVTDMNVQEYFWSACSANHLELLDCWLDYSRKYLFKAEKYTRQLFGTPGAFQMVANLPEYTPGFLSCFVPAFFAWSHTGWLAQLAWERWRYSMDVQWLEDTGYELVKSAFVFYAANLEEEQDGYLHIPLSDSPEYEEASPEAWCKDPNVDIALIRKCCDWIVEMESALGISEYSQKAKNIHKKLVPYNLVDFKTPGRMHQNLEGTKVLGLWKDKLLDQPHRHPSHLMAIHPAMDITIDGTPEDRALIDASLLQYLTLGQYHWAGHTYAQMISFAAVIGRAEMAYKFLREYCDWILPNGLHFNGTIGVNGSSWFARPFENYSPEELKKDVLTQGRDWQFTANETCSITRGISDMLLQGWGNKIRIFPAVPYLWKDLSFSNLLTEGAFKVSAEMRNSKVVMVKVEATVSGVCCLQSPFGKDKFSVDGDNPQHDGDLLLWQMAAGQRVILNAGK